MGFVSWQISTMRATDSRHDANGTVQLCHGSCSFENGGTMEDYLSKVQSWVSSNPNEGESNYPPSLVFR